MRNKEDFEKYVLSLGAEKRRKRKRIRNVIIGAGTLIVSVMVVIFCLWKPDTAVEYGDSGTLKEVQASEALDEHGEAEPMENETVSEEMK